METPYFISIGLATIGVCVFCAVASVAALFNLQDVSQMCEMDFKEQVYYSMTGSLVEPIPEVENIFERGKVYDVFYAKVFDARERLFERLGVYEDSDVEIIIDSMLTLQREVALRMYDYGAKFKDM